jgi:hypothetical protein
MPKCGICGGDAPKQPCITEDGKCDLCGRKVVLEEEKKKEKKRLMFSGLAARASELLQLWEPDALFFRRCQRIAPKISP